MVSQLTNMRVFSYVCVVPFQLGHTPLHQAAQQGHVLIIKLLLQYHANPDALTTVSNSEVMFIIASVLSLVCMFCSLVVLFMPANSFSK